jgi:hypothetical protein
MKNIILILAISTVVASCASNSHSNNRMRNVQVTKNAKQTLANKDSDEKVICKQQRRTGSNRITTVCRSSSEIAAERKATQDQLELRGTNHQTGAKGGEAGQR